MIKCEIPPVIIIGMHRSGTSLVARMLEEIGFFIGCNQDSNNESKYFLKLNNWILTQCAATWDHPDNVNLLAQNVKNYQLIIDYLEFHLKTPKISTYLGIGNFVRYLITNRIPSPWGWKDPRNTYTFNIWKEIFPGARVVHVYRHGVDNAQSLRSRNQKQIENAKNLHLKRKFIYPFINKKGGFSESLRCSSLNGGFALWEEYMFEAIKITSDLVEDSLSIKYENMLNDPEKSLIELAKFVNLPVSNSVAESICARMNKSRAYAFEKSDELVAFAELKRKALANYGY